MVGAVRRLAHKPVHACTQLGTLAAGGSFFGSHRVRLSSCHSQSGRLPAWSRVWGQRAACGGDMRSGHSTLQERTVKISSTFSSWAGC